MHLLPSDISKTLLLNLCIMSCTPSGDKTSDSKQ